METAAGPVGSPAFTLETGERAVRALDDKEDERPAEKLHRLPRLRQPDVRELWRFERLFTPIPLVIITGGRNSSMDNTQRKSGAFQSNFRETLHRLRKDLDEAKLGLVATRGITGGENKGSASENVFTFPESHERVLISALESNITRLEERLTFLSSIADQARSLSLAVSHFADNLADNPVRFAHLLRAGCVECAQEAWEVAAESGLLALDAETYLTEIRLVWNTEKERLRSLRAMI